MSVETLIAQMRFCVNFRLMIKTKIAAVGGPNDNLNMKNISTKHNQYVLTIVGKAFRCCSEVPIPSKEAKGA